MWLHVWGYDWGLGNIWGNVEISVSVRDTVFVKTIITALIITLKTKTTIYIYIYEGHVMCSFVPLFVRLLLSLHSVRFGQLLR